MRHKKASEADVMYIINILSSIYPINKELSDAFFKYTEYLEVPKDTILLKSGDFCQYMYFIKKGALMGQTTHNKKNIVTYISIENEFVSSITGLHGASPSQEAIIAVEDSQLLAIHNNRLHELFLKHFDMNFLFRVMVEKYYRDAQERSHIIRVGNAKERYLYFITTKPGYIERLPLQLVASMLDMKLPTLLKVQKQHQLSLQKDKAAEEWCRKIEQYMQESRIYRKQGLTLDELAESLALPHYKLSFILNNSYQQSFINFLNTWRINEIKAQMKDPVLMQYFTIEALAKNAGFTSRSAFYSAFKKHTGLNPSQYAKALT